MPENNSCIHCGDDCGKYPLIWEEKPFCCNGCKTVYQLLNENQLGNYYRIEPMAGIKIPAEDVKSDEQFAFLDLNDIRLKLLEFSGGGIAKVRFFIPVIHCVSCIWLLENLYKLNSAIIHSQVNFPAKEVYITFRENEISLRKVVELLASIHYLPEINLQKTDRKIFRNQNRILLTKIGIAGFAFLNAMMYHFPQYLPGNEFLEHSLMGLFRWLSLALSIPVVFYCANDYFITAFKALKKKVISIDIPLAIGLVALFSQSFFEIVTDKGIGYIDSLTGLVFFLLVGRWYQGKTYHALSFERDYKTYFPVAVTVVKEGTNQSTPIEKLNRGDRILIRNREIIPADSRLVKGNASIDYSFVTGESVTVRIESSGLIYAGGRQMGSAIELEVEKGVEQSYLTRLWNQNLNKYPEKEGLANTLNLVSQYFTVVILIIALVAAGYWYIEDSAHSLFAFTSVLIIACPCALAMTIPFTFGSTLRQFSKRGFYLKNISVIERLFKITTIVFDKTGTLTHTRLSEIGFIGKTLTSDLNFLVKSLTYHSTHPMSIIIHENLHNAEISEVGKFSELPGLGISGFVKGKKVLLGSKYFVTGHPSDENELQTEVWISVDGNLQGHFTINNKYRSGLEELTADLGKKYDLHLLSGDNDAEKKNLLRIFHKEANLNFNQSPTDKLEYVRRLQKSGHQVLMIGDGLNDAGALAESNVGIAIADDIYSFSPACDAILQSDRFKDLCRFIRFAGFSRRIVYTSFLISFLYNIVGLSFAVQGNLSPIIAAILMPLSSISIVAFATFSVALGASRKI